MKKYFVGILSIVTVVFYCTQINDPLNSLASFLIAGVVPGTNIMLGLWPTIGLAFLGGWILRRFIRNIRYHALEHTAQQIVAERAKSDIPTTESDTFVFDTSKRSIISAPTQPVTADL